MPFDGVSENCSVEVGDVSWLGIRPTGLGHQFVGYVRVLPMFPLPGDGVTAVSHQQRGIGGPEESLSFEFRRYQHIRALAIQFTVSSRLITFLLVRGFEPLLTGYFQEKALQDMEVSLERSRTWRLE